MTTPTGTIGLSDVNTELSHPSTTNITMNNTDVRTLAEKASGVITMDDLRGKTAFPTSGITTSGMKLWLSGHDYVRTGVSGVAIPNRQGGGGSGYIQGTPYLSTDGKGIEFVNANSWLKWTGTPNYNTFGSYFTVESIMYGHPGGSGAWWAGKRDTGNTGWLVHAAGATTFGVQDISAPLLTHISSTAINIVTHVFASNYLHCYVNGALKTSTVISTTRRPCTGTDNAFVLNYRSNSGAPGTGYGGRWYQTKTWTRNLSTAEILANYNAQKDYYGL